MHLVLFGIFFFVTSFNVPFTVFSLKLHHFFLSLLYTFRLVDWMNASWWLPGDRMTWVICKNRHLQKQNQTQCVFRCARTMYSENCITQVQSIRMFKLNWIERKGEEKKKQCVSVQFVLFSLFYFLVYSALVFLSLFRNLMVSNGSILKCEKNDWRSTKQ